MNSPTIHNPGQVTLNFRGRLVILDRALVMGILNLTPDSFHDGGKYNTLPKALAQAEKMLDEGAAILDIGGSSSRPGAVGLSADEEWERIGAVLAAILKEFPQALVSIDTYHASVAQRALDCGAHMINDISAGLFDSAMLDVVANAGAPYVLMHMLGTPQTMQVAPAYDNVVEEVLDFFVERVRAARKAGIVDIVLDPGFGFGKSLAHNYDLLRNLDNFRVLGLPILVGISRKSMIYKLFSTTPDDVLDLSTALHVKALEAGALILRVHDVKPAVRAVQLHQYWRHGTL